MTGIMFFGKKKIFNYFRAKVYEIDDQYEVVRFLLHKLFLFCLIDFSIYIFVSPNSSNTILILIKYHTDKKGYES